MSLAAVNDDPLLLIAATVGHVGPMPINAVESLYKLYTASADIRACLRLVDPAYLDVLSAAHLASEAIRGVVDIAEENVVGAGTRLTRLLQKAHALNNSSSEEEEAAAAATMLADMTNCPQIPDTSDDDTLLTRVRSGSPVRAHAALLRATGSSRDSSQQLLCAVVDAIVAHSASDSGLSQLLCLAAQLIEQDRVGSLAALAGLASLRGFARHVIKLLSVPAPIVAAPALHLLTLILLHPPAKVTAGHHVSPLTILADGLCGKLFDAAHIGRTLVLAADLCLNCQQAGSSTDDDLVVLGAVAGMVAAIAQCEQSSAALQAVRTAFFASTEIVPALVHITAMARVDRRYIHALLRMATAIIARPEDAPTPLVRALASESQGPSGPLPSVIGELFELVLSGIEDIDDALPRFGYPHQPSSDDDAGPRLPRVSSDESGCCWLANCPDASRRDVARFLCAALNCPSPPPPGSGDEAERWAPLLIEAVSAALGPLFAPPSSPSSEPAMLLGRHYWVDRPVLGLALDLAAGSEEFRELWQKYLATANNISGESASGNTLLLYKEIADIFALPLPSSASTAFLGDVIYQQPGQTQKSANSATIHSDLVAASVATPSESSYASSGAASPYRADGDNDVIAITDIRMAAAAAVTRPNSNGRLHREGLGISTSASMSTLQAEEENTTTATQSAKVYAAVLRQWLRSCEAQAALAIAQSTCTSPCEPPAYDIAALVARVSTFASLHRQHTSYVTALKSAIAHSVQQSHDHLLASSDAELTYLNAELNRAQARAEQLAADLAHTRKLADRHTAGHTNLCQQHDELQAKHRRIEANAGEWREECVRARDNLELNERIARDAHQNLVVQHEAEKLRCVENALTANQGVWDRRHAEMSDTVAALERALAEAVPRLRVLETQAEAERLASAELRVQNAAMAAKLADLAHAATVLHGLAQRPY
ncbi:hypothetical protein H4S07_001936 [Coemansia furcata]|uniref:Uncharacterized protein n=1 Tax=Coemansia furcata TaxID=417177 RepID=A0ACC1LLJ7_9FUNG|nr:hypothetical protein H4S07_001936 [Coemansia furcata]